MARGERPRAGDTASAVGPPLPRGVRLERRRGRPDVARLVGAFDAIDPVDLAAVLASARGSGFAAVDTDAIDPGRAAPLIAAGFAVHERLHLLDHPLDHRLPSRAGLPRLRRSRPADLPAMLAVDDRSFHGFWRFDEGGIDDAVRSTPSARVRVGGADEVVAYAITGRHGRVGYLQRLAVDPTARRRGYGRALVLDGLRWLRRRAVTRVFVNTEVGNDAALALYERCGFRRLPDGLVVLRWVP